MTHLSLSRVDSGREARGTKKGGMAVWRVGGGWRAMGGWPLGDGRGEGEGVARGRVLRPHHLGSPRGRVAGVPHHGRMRRERGGHEPAVLRGRGTHHRGEPDSGLVVMVGHLAPGTPGGARAGPRPRDFLLSPVSRVVVRVV
jgi:hypothetical protein